MIEKLIELFIIFFEWFFKELVEIIGVAIDHFTKKDPAYSAKFISEKNLLSSKHTGFCLTGDKNLSTKNSFQNALIIGGTGVGKSSVVLIPSLFSMQGSFVVHDPSGELFLKTAGYLEEKGYEVKTLNFSKPTFSAGYNPLARANSTTEIQKVASMLVENALGGTEKKDPFWNTQATALIAILIMILKTQSPEYQNLYNVRLLLNAMGGNPKSVDALFARYADEVLFSEYKSFIAYDEKMTSSVIATCKAALQIFADESIAAVTAFDSLDFGMFREKPFVLYIQNSIADQRYYSVLTSIFFEQFFSYVLSRFPEKGEQDIFFLIDEASSLRLPTLSLAVANVRKHNAGIMLLVQDFNQLTKNYGRHDAEAIRSNCFAKMYFTGQSLETTKELEQILGRFEYKDKEGKKQVRSLMTAEEIRIMQIKEAILICGHHAPMRAKLVPYYANTTLLRLSQYEPIIVEVMRDTIKLARLTLPTPATSHEEKE